MAQKIQTKNIELKKNFNSIKKRTKKEKKQNKIKKHNKNGVRIFFIAIINCIIWPTDLMMESSKLENAIKTSHRIRLILGFYLLNKDN